MFSCIVPHLVVFEVAVRTEAAVDEAHVVFARHEQAVVAALAAVRHSHLIRHVCVAAGGYARAVDVAAVDDAAAAEAEKGERIQREKTL